MSTPRKPKRSAPKELSLFEQTKIVLDQIVPLEIHDQATLEITKSDVRDQQSVNAAGLRAKQAFVDFFAQELHGRPEITPKAIEDAAIYMLLGVLEQFKKAALMQMGGFSPDVAPDAPIVRH